MKKPEAQRVEPSVEIFLQTKKKAPNGAFLVLTVLLFYYDSYLLQFVCLDLQVFCDFRVSTSGH